MTPEATAMLNALDRFFVEHAGTVAGREVWDVLTAMRGPDYPRTAALKQSSTVLIRAAAFPRTAKLSAAPFTAHHADLVPIPADRPFSLADSPSVHFSIHAASAAEALGITTHNVNTCTCIACRRGKP